MEEKKYCKKHGITLFILEGRGYFRCKKCRADAVIKRRKKLKQLAIEYKGGKCERCGYKKCYDALDFHHCNGNKEFGISAKGHTKSWEKIRIEIDKCILVCANCHREIHAEERLPSSSEVVANAC
jgi:predicted RNA-binding Zn-ribbon protein involved in translation (DUF1610 family)